LAEGRRWAACDTPKNVGIQIGKVCLISMSSEEWRREEKLLKDLDDTNNYVSSEIWKIEKADKDLG